MLEMLMIAMEFPRSFVIVKSNFYESSQMTLSSGEGMDGKFRLHQERLILEADP